MELLIVAMGGGGFSMEPDNLALDRYILERARGERPRVCFVPTASGDADSDVAEFYRAFSGLPCRPTDLALFNRQVGDLREFVLEQDVIYVGGGNTANLLAVWRAHDLHTILAEAWHSGTLLCGLSAGMNCWFQASVTDSFGQTLAPLLDGLGLLTGSSCPHYDSQGQRRPTYLKLVQDGSLPPGYAADDGAALVFSGEDLTEVVTSRPQARAFHVVRGAKEAVEEALPSRYLG
jgi:dipeptidase E